jgi:HEAT repeat protein
MHVEQDTWPLLETLLAMHQPVEVITATLKVCKDPRALDAVRHLTVHQSWAVRARAAATLEQIGDAQDRFRLQAMLSDPEWWVRYRAALALAHLPFVSRQKLADLITSLNDKFAVDILRQVSAEAAEHTPAP